MKQLVVYVVLRWQIPSPTFLSWFFIKEWNNFFQDKQKKLSTRRKSCNHKSFFAHFHLKRVENKVLYCADKLIVILYQMKRLQKMAQQWFVILEMCIMKYYIRYSELPLKCNEYFRMKFLILRNWIWNWRIIDSQNKKKFIVSLELTIEWPKYSAALSEMYNNFPVCVVIIINPLRPCKKQQK